MAREVFERYEKKYVLTKEQYSSLMLVMGGMFSLEEYGRHTICNVYFDTPDYRLIRTSLEKPLYKEKLRLRGYGAPLTDDSMVYVELKKKFRSVVYKRRIGMQLEEARRYLYYGIQPETDGQVLSELDYTMKRYELKPMAYISYEREAYVYDMDPQLRVTFDRNILGRSGELDLRVEPYGRKIIEEGEVLMEIKIPGAMPVWLCRLLGELRIFPVSYSKYGIYYSRYVQPSLNWRMMEMQMQRTEQNIVQGGIICA